MPKIPQPSTPQSQNEVPRDTLVARKFLGVDTQESRIDIADDHAWYLENLIPIGDGLQVVPNIAQSPAYDFQEAPYSFRGVNLNNVEYYVVFVPSGKVWLYNVSNSTAQVINSTSLLSGAGSWCDQWQNNVILFIDSTGYYSFDGTTFRKYTAIGVPTSGDTIAVYESRVWIASGRTLYVSGASGYDDGTVSGTNFWIPINGAAFAGIVDPQIRSKIYRMSVANGILYLYTEVGINVISNVFVPIGANPPTPQWQNNNIQAAIGSNQPLSVVPFDRFNLFASPYGAYMMYGLAAPQLSQQLVGLWKYVDLSQPISAGQVSVFSKLCAAFLVKRKGMPGLPDATILACWFQDNGKDRWWFANFGPLSLVSSTYVNGVATLFGISGTKLYQLFSDTTNAPSTRIVTKLYGLEDPLMRKEVLQAGAFMDVIKQGSSAALIVQTEAANSAPIDLGQWFNGTGTFLPNTSTPALNGRTIGFDLQTTGYWYSIHFLAADYKLRERWGTPWV